MVKKGDTLIEVTLAIGIFSMVAIAVVAVMIIGTSNAQTALETTLAREEIDTQAEALRFIHAAYLADEESGGNKDPYTTLWKAIVSNAYTPTGTDADAEFLQYAPSTCQEVYNNTSGPLSKAFIINPRALSGLTTTNTSNALISYSSSSAKFKITTTYPRIIYTSKQSTNTDSLIENPSDSLNSIQRVEGLYVLAVVDPDTTHIVGTGNTSAYFDFYIRSCWYGMGSETPTTISTVIRLYDPEGLPKDPVDSGGTSGRNRIGIVFEPNGGGGTSFSRTIDRGSSVDLTNTFTAPAGRSFLGWNTEADGSGTSYRTQTAPFSESTILYAQWGIRISYSANGGTGDNYGETILPDQPFTLSANSFGAPSGQQFLGWNTAADGSGASFQNRQIVSFSSNTTLYAQWGKIFIQDVTVSMCREQASEEDMTVYDRRDNKLYTVRYINNRCWMTKNLGFSYGLDDDWFWWWGGGGHGGVTGGYYSQLAAIDSYYVCPTHWGLPTQSEMNSLSSHLAEFKPEYIGYLRNIFFTYQVADTGAAYYWVIPGSSYYSGTASPYRIGSGSGGGGSFFAINGVPIRCVRR